MTLMKSLFIALLFYFFCGKIIAQQNLPKPADAYNISWSSFSHDSQESLPIGNGDIGLNVWTESNGDVLFYIGKTDAWSEAVNTQLVKVGKIRLSMINNTFTSATDFTQSLVVSRSEVVIKGGGSTVRVWVDANAPIIKIETQTNVAANWKITLEPWRTEVVNKVSADVVIPQEKSNITWYHRIDNPRLPSHHLTFGATIKGNGFERTDGNSLQSTKAQKQQTVVIYPYTLVAEKAEDWLSGVASLSKKYDGEDWIKAKNAHNKWWDDFWNRSYIHLTGDSVAKKVGEGYQLNRYLTACSGRGNYPMKFNGTIFNMDNPNNTKKEKSGAVVADSMNADIRAWGGQYWFQNTRPLYWPLLAAGDYDMMLPLFKMYQAMLPKNKEQVQEFYHHNGAYFQETAPFWGGISKLTKEEKGSYTKHYYLPILELSSMMLDYYHHTRDENFVQQQLLPVANAGITFYDEHFGRDANGKLLLDSVNAIEMFWKVTNPTPDIAALRWILPQLLALPNHLVAKEDVARWKRLFSELPEIPLGEKKGQKVILPYTGEQTAQARNTENPELYTIHPFRLFGIGKPDLELALATYKARAIKRTKCWHQDPIDEAYLGLTAEAQKDVTANLTNKEPRMKFPAFWEKGHDYAPDADNGGNGQHALQLMLLQAEGKTIRLLPAWPKEWEADFKLHAPMNTSVQGHVKNGKISNLVVTPANRAADVIITE